MWYYISSSTFTYINDLTTVRWFTMAGITKLVFLAVQDWTINLFLSDLREEIDGKILGHY